MAQVINTNSLSLMTQNNLNKSQSALGTAIERLSSGLRINSAKDDAAGQAISNRFTSNITGLTQASRNANDGISVAQTTEGSLSEINNNLQRIRELSVQAANGTNSTSDLDSIQDEITSRLSEIDRVSGQTQFNGVKVLAKDSTMSIQVGANDGETISIDLKAITADTLGLTGFNVNGDATKASTVATVSDLTSASYTAAPAAADGSVAYTKTTGNTVATATDLLAGLANNGTITSSTATGSLSTGATTYKYNATDKSFTYDAPAITQASASAALIPTSGISNASVKIGSTSVDVTIDNSGSIKAKDGSALYIDTTGNLTQNSAGLTAGNLATVDGLLQNGGATAVSSTITTSDGTKFVALGGTAGTVDVTDAKLSASAFAGKAFTTTVGANTINAATDGTTTGGAYMLDGKLTDAANTVSTFYAQKDGSITTSAGAKVYKDSEGAFSTTNATTKTDDPLAVLDAAISKIDQFRSSLGAVQNRFDSAITNLSNTTTNLQSAQSRIQDADYATEVSAMSKAQILQQAGTSVLAKANQVPQSVLSLLQG